MANPENPVTKKFTRRDFFKIAAAGVTAVLLEPTKPLFAEGGTWVDCPRAELIKFGYQVEKGKQLNPEFQVFRVENPRLAKALTQTTISEEELARLIRVVTEERPDAKQSLIRIQDPRPTHFMVAVGITGDQDRQQAKAEAIQVLYTLEITGTPIYLARYGAYSASPADTEQIKRFIRDTDAYLRTCQPTKIEPLITGDRPALGAGLAIGVAGALAFWALQGPFRRLRNFNKNK